MVYIIGRIKRTHFIVVTPLNMKRGSKEEFGPTICGTNVESPLDRMLTRTHLIMSEFFTKTPRETDTSLPFDVMG